MLLPSQAMLGCINIFLRKAAFSWHRKKSKFMIFYFFLFCHSDADLRSLRSVVPARAKKTWSSLTFLKYVCFNVDIWSHIKLRGQHVDFRCCFLIVRHWRCFISVDIESTVHESSLWVEWSLANTKVSTRMKIELS